MNNETRWRQRYFNFKKALIELGEAVDKKEYSKLERQGLIQCFVHKVYNWIAK